MSVEMFALPHSVDWNVFDLKEIGRKAGEAAEKEHIKNTLSYTNWNRKAAARLLQVSYKALLYKIEKYELNGSQSKKRNEL